MFITCKKQYTDSIFHLNSTFILVPSSQCSTGSMYRYEEMLRLEAMFAAGYKYSSLVFPVGPFMLKMSPLKLHVCIKTSHKMANVPKQFFSCLVTNCSLMTGKKLQCTFKDNFVIFFSTNNKSH